MGKEKMPRQPPMNPGEAQTIKAVIFDLSENGAKQALYGMVQHLCIKTSVPIVLFKEIVDDACRYCEVKRRKP